MASIVIHNDERAPEDKLDECSMHIDNLPDDCILSIFGHFSTKELLALTLVSKRFNSLADRSFRLRSEFHYAVIKNFPSLKVQKFGSSIKGLHFECEVNEEMLKEMCELQICPNLRALYFDRVYTETLSNSYFKEMLSQLHELNINKIRSWSYPVAARRNLKKALQCCKNLMYLNLAPAAKECIETGLAPWPAFPVSALAFGVRIITHALVALFPKTMASELAIFCNVAISSLFVASFHLPCKIHSDFISRSFTCERVSNFETFFQVKFPKLQKFRIDMSCSLSYEHFTPFLQSNTTITTLIIEGIPVDVDLSEILSLQRLEHLELSSVEDRPINSILPILNQLTKLKHLNIRLPFNETVFKTFINSIQEFKNLKELMLCYNGFKDFFGNSVIFDIQDEDLLRLRYLPNVTQFHLHTSINATFVTLPGILRLLKGCPKMIDFNITGFRQNHLPGGNILIDDDIYVKFFMTYIASHHTDNFVRVRKISGYQPATWYDIFGAYNMIDIFKTCI